MTATRLVPIACEPWPEPLPLAATEIIASAGRCIERLRVVLRDRLVASYHPSDFELAYRTLRALVVARFHLGWTFTEWGAGVPAVSALAAQLGFSTRAIESDAELAAAGRRWIAEESLPIDLIEASFIPREEEPWAATWPPLKGANPEWPPATLSTAGACADVVFAYPWPGEDEYVSELFRRCAPPGSLLVTFHGSLDMQVRRLLADADIDPSR